MSARTARRGPLFKDMAKNKKAGRPPLYSPELGAKICDHIREGVSPGKIATMPGMPCRQTISRWLNEHKDFEQEFFAAKRAAMLFLEEELDTITQAAVDFALTANPQKVAVSAVVNAYNNQAHHVKWKMATLYRERYGEKVGLEHSGELNISLADAISKARKRRDES